MSEAALFGLGWRPTRTFSFDQPKPVLPGDQLTAMIRYIYAGVEDEPIYFHFAVTESQHVYGVTVYSDGRAALISDIDHP